MILTSSVCGQSLRRESQYSGFSHIYLVAACDVISSLLVFGSTQYVGTWRLDGIKSEALHWGGVLGCTEVSLMLYWSIIPYGVLSFPFLVWVRVTFACIIPAMFLSEFELAPNIVITSLFYLNSNNHGSSRKASFMSHYSVNDCFARSSAFSNNWHILCFHLIHHKCCWFWEHKRFGPPFESWGQKKSDLLDSFELYADSAYKKDCGRCVCSKTGDRRLLAGLQRLRGSSGSGLWGFSGLNDWEMFPGNNMWEAECSYISMRLHYCDCGEEHVCLVLCSSA